MGLKRVRVWTQRNKNTAAAPTYSRHGISQYFGYFGPV